VPEDSIYEPVCRGVNLPLRQRPRAPADLATISSARVLLPTWRAPLTTTTLVSASASVVMRSA
jgi:hypothetical protein